MSKIIKLTELDLNRIVKKVLQEQLTVDSGQNFKTFEKNMMGVNPQPRKFNYKIEDTVVTSLNWGSADKRNKTASYSVSTDSRDPLLKIAPTNSASELSRYNTQLLAKFNKFLAKSSTDNAANRNTIPNQEKALSFKEKVASDKAERQNAPSFRERRKEKKADMILQKSIKIPK